MVPRAARQLAGARLLQPFQPRVDMSAFDIVRHVNLAWSVPWAKSGLQTCRALLCTGSVRGMDWYGCVTKGSLLVLGHRACCGTHHVAVCGQ